MPPIPKAKTYKQDPPNAVQVELVEGCSLNCQFCGVQGIREARGGYRFMSEATMEALVQGLRVAMDRHGWNPRIELAMHGEPTMHPRLIEMTERLGSLKPRELILVSNGTGLAKDPNRTIDALAAAGMTSFCLDEYDGCDFVQKIRERYTGVVPMYDFTGENGQKFRSNAKLKPPYIVIKEDVSHLAKPYDKVNTHCGGGGPPGVNEALHKRCAKPFRELSVRWDGNVALCCNDFRGIYKIGNVSAYANDLDALWQHPNFQAARQLLYAANRDFNPCKWCNALSPRVGLLPDKYGKQSLEPPTLATRATAAEAAAGRPYTVPVLRGWETGSQGEPCLPEGYPTAGLKVQSLDAAQGGGK